MISTVNGASPIKRRRATKEEMQQRREALLTFAFEEKPVAIRRLFYRSASAGLIEKTEQGYRKIQSTVTTMRQDKTLPWSWISDGTRLMRKPRTYKSIEDALEWTAETYRKNLWADSDVQVEVWCEKDAITGTIYPVTSEYDVPLMIARGFSSLSFLYNAAMQMQEDGRPAYIYHLGDWDPSGQAAANHIERQLREFAPDVEINFVKLALTQDQIEHSSLPTRPTKKTDSRTKNWTGGGSVELDAMDANELRGIVRSAIERHLPAAQLKILKVAEESERELLWSWVDEASETIGP